MKKKRFYYVVASFMRKDVKNTQTKVDFTIMNDNDPTLFPLMEAVYAIKKGYADIADINTIQFDSLLEISEKDYEAYNKFKGLNKVEL